MNLNTKRTMKTEINDAIDALDEREKRDVNKLIKVRIIFGIFALLVLIYKTVYICLNIPILVDVFSLNGIQLYLHLYFIFKTILLFLAPIIIIVSVIHSDTRVRKALTRMAIAFASTELILTIFELFHLIQALTYNMNSIILIILNIIIIGLSIYILSLYKFETYYPKYLNDLKDDVEDLEIDYSIKHVREKNKKKA